MLVLTGELISHGCDWITITSSVGETDGKYGDINPVWSFASNMLDDHRAEVGEDTREVRFGGYKGLSFERGKQKFGQRMRSGFVDVIYIASSNVADRVIRRMQKNGLLEDDRVKVTRFDHQVTIKSDRQWMSLLSDQYDVIQQSKEVGESLVGRRKTTLYRGGNGETLYVGSRSSKGNLYRIYDRGFKMGYNLGECFRFEVERGRKTAKSGVVGYLDDRVWIDKVFALGDEFTAKCGLTFRTQWKNITELSPAAQSVIDNDIDNRSTISWLRRCVRKPVKRMIDNGLEKDVLIALGLD